MVTEVLFYFDQFEFSNHLTGNPPRFFACMDNVLETHLVVLLRYHTDCIQQCLLRSVPQNISADFARNRGINIQFRNF
jgi:hypothetical protein